jgi:hypothetical protein
MTGDLTKSLTNDQINQLIDAIVNACGDKYKLKITRPAGGGGGGGGGGGRATARSDDGRQFDWLEIMYGMRRRVVNL